MHLPANVLWWIGGSQASLGEHGDEGMMRAIFMGGVGRIGGVGKMGKSTAGMAKGPSETGGGGETSSDTKILGTGEETGIPDLIKDVEVRAPAPLCDIMRGSAGQRPVCNRRFFGIA
jgi:hypothetical protein